MTQFVDDDHVGNMINSRLHTGILIYLFRDMIIWYIKKQNTAKSSMFV